MISARPGDAILSGAFFWRMYIESRFNHAFTAEEPQTIEKNDRQNNDKVSFHITGKDQHKIYFIQN